MTENKDKRAVIISNIKSSSIEQAIFILKTPEVEKAVDMGSGIVAEAQEIINSYINTIEKNQQKFKQKKSLSRRAITAVTAGVCFVLAFLTVFLMKL